MPTPQRTRDASLEKRRRICTICGTQFFVRSANRKGVTCSRPCFRINMTRLATGRKQSPETLAKRAEKMKAIRADPEYREKWRASVAAGIAKWHSDPKNAENHAKQSSERMKRRHADPEWQKIRDERSSRTMKENWEKHRELFTAQAVERYKRNIAKGIGINGPDADAKKRVAAKWIMKKAQAALHTETDYDAIYTEVQSRLRREMPYDGPQECSDYLEYLRALGRAVTMSTECRRIADGFMSEAIPRFSAEWRSKHETCAASPVGSADASDCPDCDVYGNIWNNNDPTSGQRVRCDTCNDERGHP